MTADIAKGLRDLAGRIDDNTDAAIAWTGAAEIERRDARIEEPQGLSVTQGICPDKVKGERDRMRAALEKIMHLCAAESPVMDAWDKARAFLLNGNHGSLPRDIMESGIDEFYEVAVEALSELPRDGSTPQNETALPIGDALREGK